jgi:NAD(P)-dependent dehydrogenase (short-subunit alcohol dehydrogenase family)
MRLANKIGIITGAGSGIGRATALASAREGADIVVFDLNPAAAEATVRELTGLGRRALAVTGDVTKEADVDRLTEVTLREFGRIDLLMNNAGVADQILPTLEQSVQSWERVMDIHLKGMYLCCRRIGREMLRQMEGRIVSVSSVAGFVGFPMRTAYGPAKAGIAHLTRVLAVEWASYNIRVNAIAPGYVRTPLVENIIKEGKLEEKRLVERTPMGRLARPEEIAAAAVFLFSDDASYITGVTLPVDGGYLAYGL